MGKRRDYLTDIKPSLLDYGYLIASEDKDYKNSTTNISLESHTMNLIT